VSREQSHRSSSLALRYVFECSGIQAYLFLLLRNEKLGYHIPLRLLRLGLNDSLQEGKGFGLPKFNTQKISAVEINPDKFL
jgi:hypothetical protein